LKYNISGLYAITPEENNTDRLLQKVALAFQGGARVLQYRNKTGSLELRQVQAQVLRELSREYNVPLIINDDALLAKQVDADGVHLGGEDGSIAAARALLGADKLIGVSCYNQLNLARIAAGQGADYFAFGAFYASTIKPDACIASLELLKQARREFTRPLVAIGGINPENAMPLLAAGADALAVISALFSSPDIQQAAMQFNLTIMAGKPLSR
jgi:thiamine-phosphate pyrophosphorylase